MFKTFKAGDRTHSDRAPSYQATIGLEIHVELSTQTKMYCGCKNDPFNSPPNSNVCPVCLGLPGSLPVVNRAAVLDTIKIGKALGSHIAIATKWDRKHYFYPDLPKNYQISQFDLPICQGGYLVLASGKKIELTRIHLEEDTAKLLHFSGQDYSLIDLNRAGVPLVELVSEPMIQNGKEAREFCEEYQLILRYLGVSKADMEKGEMRAEVNISLSQISNLTPSSDRVTLLNDRVKSQNDNPKLKTAPNYSGGADKNQKLGTKVEVKNLNSFRSVERAIGYEIKRQSEVLERGEKVVQETRGWNDSKQKTYLQRVKETSADYRYFPEPDIPPVETQPLIAQIKKLPELPREKREKFKIWGVADKDIRIIISNPKMADYFERVSYNTNDKKILANLLINEAPDMKLKPNDLAHIANMIDSEEINRAIAKEMIGKVRQGENLKKLFSQYHKIEDTAELKKIARQIIKDNPEVVAKIRKGKTSAIQHLVGQVMQATRGQADPQKVGEMVKEFLTKPSSADG